MYSISSMIVFLALGILASAFLMAGRTRLMSLVATFRLQSLFLAVYTLVLAFQFVDIALYIAAIAIVAIKCVAVPMFLLRSARNPGVSQRLESYLRPSLRTVIASLLIAASFFAAKAFSFPNTDYVVVATSFSLIMVGFSMLITQRDMFGQGTGFLTFENGIFTFGLALTHGMPFLVEIGVLFDVLVGFVLMVALVNRAHREHASVTTDYLRKLVG